VTGDQLTALNNLKEVEVPGQEVNKYSHNKKGLFWADLKKFSY
jgi:hypothetical protein